MTDTLAPSTSAPHNSAQAAAQRDRIAHGEITIARISNQMAITRLMAQSPMKILTPRHAGHAASAFISTLGGGLVAGDHLRVSVELEQGAYGVIGTQSTTKVYRSTGGLECVQDLVATLAPQSILMMLPDPVMCFAGARYRQRQRIYLPPAGQGAGLCLIDWLVSGRRARGECWAFESYLSHNDIYAGDQLVLHDALRLTQQEGPLNHASRLGRYHCLATLVLLGEPMRQAAATILDELAHQPVVRSASLVAAASPLSDGVLVRIAGHKTQDVAHELRRWCRFTCNLIGDDPWARKW